MALVPPKSYGDELPAGTVLAGGQYTIEGYLNSGGFGVTYLATDSLGRRVVIKECFPSAMCCRTDATVRLRSRCSQDEFGAILELFEKEARALAALQHPYIVGVHQFFRDNGTAYMAMDYVEGRTLLELIEQESDRLGPREVKRLLMQLLQAVGYIHANDILHRDISPDNILVDADNLPVLIDFGAARESATRVSRVLSKVLTVKDGYSPQEFYLQGSDQVFSSDLYALAATFYHVVARTPPPSSHTRLAAAARDMADPYIPLGEIAGYDAYFTGAINKCMSIFPKDRLPSADAWRDQVDLERRKQAMLEQAEKDEALEQVVADLVADFEAECAEAEARRKAKAKARAEEKAKAEAEAKRAAQAKAQEEARAAARAKAQEEARIKAEAVAAARAQAEADRVEREARARAIEQARAQAHGQEGPDTQTRDLSKPVLPRRTITLTHSERPPPPPDPEPPQTGFGFGGILTRLGLPKGRPTSPFSRRNQER